MHSHYLLVHQVLVMCLIMQSCNNVIVQNALESCFYSNLFGHTTEQMSLAVTYKRVHALDIVPLRSETPPQKRSGMARVLKGFNSFTCTPTRSSTIGMSHTCLCLPSYRWYSFTDPGGMEG